MGREPTLYDGAVKYFFGVNPVIPCFHVAEWRTSQWCNTLLPVEILRKMECNESPNSNNHYIPGSQMGPLVLIVKGHLLEGWIPKIEDKQVPGIWCFQISIQLKNKRASLIQPQFLWKKSSSPNSFFVFFVSLTKIPKQKKKVPKQYPTEWLSRRGGPPRGILWEAAPAPVVASPSGIIEGKGICSAKRVGNSPGLKVEHF